MIHMHIPKYFWAGIVLISCHLIIRVYSSNLDGKIPFSVFYPKKEPFDLPPKVFECVYFVQILKKGHDNLDPRATHF